MSSPQKKGLCAAEPRRCGRPSPGSTSRPRKVRSEIEQLRGFWTGAAAASFTTLMSRWDEQARQLNEVLVTLEDALAGTERDQAATEEAHQQTISGLGSMMGS